MLQSMLGNSKIVMLTHEFYPKRGGIAIYCEEMAKAAVKRGYNLAVWAPQHLALANHSMPFPLKPLNNRGSLNWPCRIITATEIIKHYKSINDATLYLPEPGPIITAMYLQLTMPLPGKRKVMTLHGSEILRFTRSPHRTFLFKKLLAQMDRIGVVSKYVGGLLLAKFPEVKGKIEIVSGALRSDFFGVHPAEPQANLSDQPADKLRIITVGRIHPRKGQHFVIAALGLLPAALKATVEYHIIGPIVQQGYFEQLHDMAEQSNISINFVGEVGDDRLHHHYTQADIFCMTSAQQATSIEGFGLVYLEASYCGLPIVAHDTGGVSEAVRDGETGIIVSPGNTQHLAQALQKLIANPALRKQLGAAGRQRVRELSWSENVEMLFG